MGKTGVLRLVLGDLDAAFVIRAAKNGTVVEHVSVEDGEMVTEWWGCATSGDSPVKAWADFLDELTCDYGPSEAHNKYGAETIEIRVVPGRKYEEIEKDKSLLQQVYEESTTKYEPFR